MADVLSLSEVESLLSVLDSNGSWATIAQPSECDRPQPERVRQEQMQSILALHAGIGHELSDGLSWIVRASCDVQLAGTEQLSFGEFVASLETPTCIYLLDSKGLDGPVVVEMNSSIVFPIVDRLLGGGTETMPLASPQRPLTAIECTLMSRVTDLVLKAVENAWANVCDLQPGIDVIADHPSLRIGLGTFLYFANATGSSLRLMNLIGSRLFIRRCLFVLKVDHCHGLHPCSEICSYSFTLLDLQRSVTFQG